MFGVIYLTCRDFCAMHFAGGGLAISIMVTCMVTPCCRNTVSIGHDMALDLRKISPHGNVIVSVGWLRCRRVPCSGGSGSSARTFHWWRHYLAMDLTYRMWSSLGARFARTGLVCRLH